MVTLVKWLINLLTISFVQVISCLCFSYNLAYKAVSVISIYRFGTLSGSHNIAKFALLAIRGITFLIAQVFHLPSSDKLGSWIWEGSSSQANVSVLQSSPYVVRMGSLYLFLVFQEIIGIWSECELWGLILVSRNSFNSCASIGCPPWIWRYSALIFLLRDVLSQLVQKMFPFRVFTENISKTCCFLDCTLTV